jgi:DNA-binding transcriptional ArsR family regulator
MRSSLILEVLFPEVRAKLLAATFGQPDREWYVTELAKALDTQPSSLQRELEALSKAGILEQRRDGRRVYVKPDRTSPVFADLRSLLEKTAGLIPILRGELETLGEGVRLAFVYGSIARSEETSASDIDLMVVGKVGLADLIPALRNCERTLGRPVNPTVYSLNEFQEKARKEDHFLTTVLRGAKQFVKGGEHELETIVGERRGQTSPDQQARTRQHTQTDCS